MKNNPRWVANCGFGGRGGGGGRRKEAAERTSGKAEAAIKRQLAAQ